MTGALTMEDCGKETEHLLRRQRINDIECADLIRPAEVQLWFLGYWTHWIRPKIRFFLDQLRGGPLYLGTPHASLSLKINK